MLTAEAVATSLLSTEPAADLQREFIPLAPLIGSWTLQSTQHHHSGEKSAVSGFVHFAWGMGGRAMLEVWGFEGGVMASTTTYYDPKIERFRSTWVCPARNTMLSFIGHAIEQRLILSAVNVDPPQRRIRWTFHDITTEHFTWQGEYSDDAGMQWRTTQEMIATRSS